MAFGQGFIASRLHHTYPQPPVGALNSCLQAVIFFDGCG